MAQLPFATEETYHRRGRQVPYQHEVLSFALGGEEHGLDIRRLREIIRPRPVTEVPRAPAFIVGIISVRGEIVPVIELGRRLRRGAPRPVTTKESRVLIVERDGEAYGLAVDAVHQVVRLRDEDVEPPPAMLGVGDSELISGLARPRPDRLIILLDLDAVLSLGGGGGRP